ncbi:unnamed protein product, partial [Rotaria sp. Silwood2]
MQQSVLQEEIIIIHTISSKYQQFQSSISGKRILTPISTPTWNAA